jgi:hypothetical protein
LAAKTQVEALLVEKRRQIMQAWGDYLAMAEAENVIPLCSKASTTSGYRVLSLPEARAPG